MVKHRSSPSSFSRDLSSTLQSTKKCLNMHAQDFIRGKIGYRLGKKEMSTKKKKRIYNPVTGTYYRIRQRSSNKGRRGTIIEKWSPPAKKAKKNKVVKEINRVALHGRLKC